MNLMFKLAEKFSIKYSQQKINSTDPAKNLLNSEGKAVYSDEEIFKVQKKLKEHGFNLETNGVWNEKSYYALVKLQQKFNLPADGTINLPTGKFLGMIVLV